MKGAIIVTLSALYCSVFSAVNETRGNLTALHSIFHQRGLSSCRRVSLWSARVRLRFGGKALQSDYAGRVGILRSKLTCYH